MKRLAIVVALSCLLAAPAAAQTGGKRQVVRSDALTGYQEVPAVSTTGVGQFEAEIDDEMETITYVLSYSGLEGGTTSASHIHFGQRGVAGGVAAFLCGGGGKPACPQGEGTVSGVITAADVIGPNPQGIEPGSFAELVRAMRAGMSYANVHSSPRWPGGEIRGQINDQNQR